MPPKKPTSKNIQQRQQSLDQSAKNQITSKSNSKSAKNGKKSRPKTKCQSHKKPKVINRLQQVPGVKYCGRQFFIQKTSEVRLQEDGTEVQYDVERVYQIMQEGSRNGSTGTQCRNNQTRECQQQQPTEQNILKYIISEQPGFKITQENIIEGCSGHGRIFFNRPIIEGNYYIRVKVISCGRINDGFKYPSSVRIGLCETNYQRDLSIGSRSNSIAYCSSDGSILLNGNKQGYAIPYGENDNILIKAKFYPLHKHRKQGQINRRMSLSFYRNKAKVFSMTGIPDTLYSFAISLYNKAKVQLFYRFQDESQHRQKRNQQRIDDYCQIFEAAFFRKIKYKEYLQFNYQQRILNLFQKANFQRQKLQQRARFLHLIQGSEQVKSKKLGKCEKSEVDEQEV